MWQPARAYTLAYEELLVSNQLASILGARSVQVFSLYQARGFWLAIGFEPHRTVPRLLTKF
jgi:hypothetical protein